MQDRISENTKAILMLTGQLLRGRDRADEKPLTMAEYNKLAQWLRSIGKEPADLVGIGSTELEREIPDSIDRERIGRLLMQWLPVGIAVDYWHDRSIWVVSRADSAYPPSLKRKLRDQAPPLLYGCGSPDSLRQGGLAVVGSRNAGKRALECARQFGRLAGEAGRTVISGGARGVDRAAMDGALEAGGCAVGVLADRLDDAAVNRQHREPLRDGRLTLVSPFDPSVRFQSWNAMARNKAIYALGDAGLVVDTAYGKGGTWSGAVEQLEKFKSVPIFVLADGETKEGVGGLRDKGALAWPNPSATGEMAEVLDRARDFEGGTPTNAKLPLDASSRPPRDKQSSWKTWHLPYEELHKEELERIPGAKETVWNTVKEVIALECRIEDKTASEIREALGTEKRQTDLWLKRMVEEGRLVKKSRPVRYLTVKRQT